MINSWKEWLEIEFKKDYFKKLWSFVLHQYQTKKCFPKKDNIFKVFRLISKEKIKVVILGQDPYFNENQADGLAFSVSQTKRLPPSLKNIFKELKSNFGYSLSSNNGDLISWAKQGVFLLNTVLTVEHKKPLSHQKQGWEEFTDAVISEINNLNQPIVFVLWGKKAQTKEELLNNTQHLILKTSHPSPMSAFQGFFGFNTFFKVNQFLKENNVDPIDWKIKN